MKELITTLHKAAQLESQLTNTPIPEELENQLKLWGAGIFRLVVMGEIKKGKSSFINAMLGEKDLVPVSSNVATSTIFKIRYGQQRAYRVFFRESAGRQPLPISEAELAHYGTEDGNPGNREQVDFIEVCCPAPLLRSGIVVIDTPGLGGLFRGHKQITYEYVPKADAVFFVTDSMESPIGQLELEYINDIRRITPLLYFVQTKCCAVDTQARQARKTNNLSILSRALGRAEREIPYFLLDSRLRFEADEYKDMDDLKESGYPQLLAFIQNELQAKQQQFLAMRAISRMEPTLVHLQEILQSRRDLVQADTEEKRRAREEKVAELQRELNDWQERQQPEIFNALQNGLDNLRIETTNMCSKCRPGGEIQMQFEQMVHECEDKDALAAKLAEINEKLPSYVSQVSVQISQDVQKKATVLMRDLIKENQGSSSLLDAQLEELSSMNTQALERALASASNSSMFSSLRTGLYGGIAGMTIASVAGGIIGSIVPGIGTIIGSSVGMIIASAWGGSAAISIQTEQELKACKNEACNALAQAMSSVYTQIQSHIEQVLSSIRQKTKQSITEYVRKRRDELKEQQEEIRNRAQMDNAELQKRTQEVRMLEREIAVIIQKVQPWGQTFPAR